MSDYRNPFPTVDVIVEVDAGIVLIERRNEPRGWALPGGFVDYGEKVEDAARREVHEETGLDVELVVLLGVYSDPTRDPRQHNLSVTYVGRANGTPKGADDAARAIVAPLDALPTPLCFDHAQILADYQRWRSSGSLPRPDGDLNATAQAHLLAAARDALEAAVSRRPPRPTAAETEGPLGRLGACFVTLRSADGELRGCLGTLSARRALAQEVRDMTAASALRDPRFPPATEAELPGIHIGISVLTPPVPSSPGSLVVGRHGVVVERGVRRGVLLPQVAIEAGWDRETFLAHTCRKANLPDDAWKDPETRVLLFEAQVFGEA